MREYKRGEKPVIHQSNHKLFKTCPYSYKLSLEPSEGSNGLDINSDAQWRGLLIEAYVWGYKGGDMKDIELWGTKELIKGGYPVLRVRELDELKRLADLVRPYFPEDGESFHKIEYESEDFILQGEIDFLPAEGNKIQDLKCTGDINKMWGFYNWKNEEDTPSRWNLLQSVYYPYIIYKNSGVLIDLFEYVILDTKREFIKVLPVHVTLESFEWLEREIEILLNTPKLPEANQANCSKSNYGKPCRYLDRCEYGQKVYCGHLNEVHFDYLPPEEI